MLLDVGAKRIESLGFPLTLPAAAAIDYNHRVLTAAGASMISKNMLTVVSLVITFAAGYVCASLSRAHADPQPAFDRALVERIVRAQEEQTREQEGQRRALEAINRTLEHLKR